MKALTLVALLCACSASPTPGPCIVTPQAAASATTAATASLPSLEGPWHGVLAGKLHLSLVITRGPSGLGAVLDSIDQGATLPIDHFTAEGAKIRFEIAAVGGSFDGKLEASGSIVGKWTQHGIEQPLAFDKGPSEAKREAPPPPLDAPIDVAVVTTPSAFRSDDHTHYVYELKITNFSSRDIVLSRLEVESRGASLLRLESGELAAACGRTGNVEIGAGRHVVAYLWVTADGSPPTSLDHKLVVRVGDADFPVSGIRVPVRDAAPVMIGPPLRGKSWRAVNGPSNTSQHRRALLPIGGRAHIAQRFAIDWVKVDDRESTFKGDHDKNESYYCYGAEALAVADGVVTETKDGIAQNVPGARAVPITLETIAGNHIVVDLGGGHFAFWAHFQPGSLRVKVGDHVKRGQVLGLVGNSGNSSEPHLHFHVEDAASPLASEGIPYAFDSFQLRGADGTYAARAKELPSEKEIVAFP